MSAHIDIIKAADGELARRAPDYKLYGDYYRGEHPLKFLSKDFENPFGEQVRGLRDNQMKRVVNLMVDRLIPTGVVAASPTTTEADAKRAWELWTENRMDVRGAEAMREGGRKGDSYMVTWVTDGRVTIYTQSAGSTIVNYDPAHPGRAISAVKFWQEGKTRRATVWTLDDVAEYAAAEKGEWAVLEGFPQINPVRRVPVAHLAANADIGEPGVSDMADGLPLQDLLNKSLAGQCVTGEAIAMPLRYSLGIDGKQNDDGTVDPPFKYNSKKFMWSPAGPDEAMIGQLEAPGLGDFLSEQDALRVEIARVCNRPVHLMLQTGDASGVSKRVDQSGFTAEVRARMLAWGYQIADLLSMAVQLDRIANGQEPGEAPVFELSWRDPEPASDDQRQAEAELLHRLGVPLDAVLVEYGFDPERAAELAAKAEAEAGRRADLAARAFDAGIAA